MAQSLKSIIIGSSVLALSATAQKTPLKWTYDHQEIAAHDSEIIQWYLKGIRGGWYGFYRGFYHEKQHPDKECLSDAVETQLSDLMQFLAYGELADIF